MTQVIHEKFTTVLHFAQHDQKGAPPPMVLQNKSHGPVVSCTWAASFSFHIMMVLFQVFKLLTGVQPWGAHFKQMCCHQRAEIHRKGYFFTN